MMDLRNTDNKDVTVYYCKCSAECYKSGKNNHDDIRIRSREVRTISGLSPNTNYCFFDNIETKNVDYRIKTAPTQPSNYGIQQHNIVYSSTSLQASWDPGFPYGENYPLTYHIIRKNSIGAVIGTTVTQSISAVFTAIVDTVVTYEVYATNSETEPKTGNLIFSTPATLVVAVPSPPQIVSVTFSSTHAFVTLSESSSIPTQFRVCAANLCTTTATSPISFTWNPNTRQRIDAQNLYANAYLSSVQSKTVISPPPPATNGSYSLSSNIATLQWFQTIVGTLPVTWFVSIYSSSRQVLVLNNQVNINSYQFSIQQGSSYYAEITSSNGFENATALVIPFGSPPLPVSILSFLHSPLQSTISISHEVEPNQNVLYTYTWMNSNTQQVLYRVNSTNTTVVWNHQGSSFGTPVKVQVTAANSFGLSSIVERTMVPQQTTVQINSPSSGVYSLKLGTEASNVQSYYLLIKDSSNGAILSATSSSTDTFIISTLQPVVSLSIVVAVQLLSNNQIVPSTPSIISSFVTQPLPIQQFLINCRNATTLCFSYQDSLNNPSPQSVSIHLYETQGSTTPFIRSNSLVISNVPSSSSFYANIVISYRYNISNSMATPIYVTTPPFAPVLDIIQFNSNSYCAINWEPYQQGRHRIVLYSVRVFVQEFMETPLMIANFTSAEAKWETIDLIPNAKYSMFISSINSESVSSLDDLEYHFFSYPENPTNYIEAVYADYMDLSWLQPAKAHSSLKKFAYEMIYFLEGFMDQNNSIKIEAYYVPNSSVRYLLLDLEPENVYAFSIKTTSFYENGENRTTDFGDAIHSTTSRAIPPVVAPKLRDIDVGYLTSSSFLVEWDAIDASQSGNAKLLYYSVYLNYTDKGVPRQEEFRTPIIMDMLSYRHSVVDVPSGTTFAIFVTVSNRGGASPLSNIVHIETRTDPNSLVDGPPLLAIVISIFSICILFCIITVILLFIIIGAFFLIKRAKPAHYVAYELQQSLLPNEVGSQYVIDSRDLSFTDSVVLGTGSHGTVCSANFRGALVAVKIYPRMLFGVENDFSDFHTESTAMAKHSNHINIVRFIGVSEDSDRDQLMLVTELCKGGNLAAYSEKHGLSFSDWNEKMHILKGIAAGMSFLHSRDVAHRDLKCENVLLDESLTAKIIDFGFTKQTKEAKANNTTVRFGTACYLAPEAVEQLAMFRSSVFKNQNQDKSSLNTFLLNSENEQNEVTEAYQRDQLVIDMKCDIYSFAVIMYVILTGRTAPYGKQATDIQILHQMHLNPNMRPIIQQETQQFVQQYKLEWYINLMKKCWSSDSKLRPSFATILSLLQDNSVSN